MVLNIRACLHPATITRRTSVTEVLSPSWMARIGTFGSAAAKKCVSRRDDGALFKWMKNALWRETPWPHQPSECISGASALVLRACLNPEWNPRISCARNASSPSFRARIRTFGGAAATKCVRRRDDELTRKTHVFHPPGDFSHTTVPRNGPIL